MSYPGYPPTGYHSCPGCLPAGQESSFPPPGQYPYPSGFPPMGGAPSGSYPGGGDYPAPRGYPASGGQGFGVPPGGSGFSGYPQPPPQTFGGGGPPQLPVPGGFPGGQMVIRPAANFDSMRDAEILRKAMKGFGTDEQADVDVVANHSNNQRQKIKTAFKNMYGKVLIKDLKSELNGNMEELILAFFMPPTYYDAWSLQNGMHGAGTHSHVFLEILCIRTNQEIQEAVRCYQSEFGQDLEKDIQSDTWGRFERLLGSMCQGNLDENQRVNHQVAQEDAQHLYQAGEGRLGTDESYFNMILAMKSFPQLRATMEAYLRMANQDLLSSVSQEFSSYCALNRPAFFAERLYCSMRGADTDDSTLIRIVMFTQMYQKTLGTMIAGYTTGDY
uniref:Annexin n=1 Tax=Chinchilla lanigera TaxID=34839 RepID=A0A8C2UY56_CHILA